jgi:peptide/nickel transport system substrate-binding protein
MGGCGVRSGGVAALMVAGALLLTACGGSAAPTTSTGTASKTAAATGAPAAQTRTLSAGFWSAPDSFNGVTAQSGYDDSVIALMFDTLVWQSPDQQFHPLLASSWDVSPDYKTFTFHLNPNAKWTDGQPVTASDVAYTMQINADPKVPAAYGTFMSVLQGTNAQGQSENPSQPLPGVKVVDDHTVQLLTKQPTDPTQLLSSIGTNIFILPQHVLKDVADTDFAKAPFFQDPNVSDGPYEFVKYVTSQYVQLKPNPGYYLGAPKLDQLFVKVVPATSMLAELRDGSVDATIAPGEADVPLQDWPSIASLPNVKQDPVPGTVIQFMMINTAKPYLQSAQVRQAITMAINRQEIVTQLLKGLGSVPIGPVNQLYKNWYDGNIQPWPYDPAKAKQMLQAANFPFSQQLTLLVPTGNQIRMESAPLIQQDLQAVGLNVKIQQYDFATMLSTAKAGNFDFALIGSGFGSDPSESALFFTCKGSLNYGKFCDPAIDKDYSDGNATAVTADRQRIYDDLQQRIHDEAPFVFLYDPNGLMAYNTRINQAAIPTAYGMQQSWLWDVNPGAQ